jgi:hypothetical protein
MKLARNTITGILSVFLVSIVMFISSVAFALGSVISGSVKELSNTQGIEGVIITIKDESIGTAAGTGTTDALGNYSVDVSSLGNYTLDASNPGHNDISSPDVMGLSDMTPNRTVNISMGRKAGLKEKPKETTKTLSWGTAIDKSYLSEALEIPNFIVLLCGYDWLAYSDESAGGEKTCSTNLSSFRYPIVHGHWEIDRDAFAMKQFNQPYQGRPLQSASLNYLKLLFIDNVIRRPAIVRVRNYLVPHPINGWQIQSKASYSSIGIHLKHSW